MTCGIALAVMVAMAFGRSFAAHGRGRARLLTLGYPGAWGSWARSSWPPTSPPTAGSARERRRSGTRSAAGRIFDVISWPLIMAVPGTLLLLAVLMLRAPRADLGWWPGVLVIVGFVASSGEFPDAVTITGWALLVPAVAALGLAWAMPGRQPTLVR